MPQYRNREIRANPTTTLTDGNTDAVGRYHSGMRVLLPFLLLSAMIAAERPANRAVDLELPIAGQPIQLRL